MTEEERAAEEYKATLSELNSNSKVEINALTMLAEDNKEYALSIAACIENHLKSVPNRRKLPILYLIDSICKNYPKSTYVQLFTQNIVSNFCNVFEVSDEKVRKSLHKLRMTWSATKIFPQKKLNAIDERVHKMDPNWPILHKMNPAAVPQQKPQPPQQSLPPSKRPKMEPDLQTIPQADLQHPALTPVLHQLTLPTVLQPILQPNPQPIINPMPQELQPQTPMPVMDTLFVGELQPPQVPVVVDPIYRGELPPVLETTNGGEFHPATIGLVSKSLFQLPYQSILDSLYEGKQCSNCSLRFDDNNRYAIHLDWHFRQNQKIDNVFARRKWYYPLNLWVQFREINDDDLQENNHNPDCNANNLLLPANDHEVPTAPASTDDEKNICSVCHETFEKFWAEEEEEWRLKNARLFEDERVYHPPCLIDMLQASVSEGTVSG